MTDELKELESLVGEWRGIFDFGTDDDDMDILTFKPQVCIDDRCECVGPCTSNVADFDMAHESIASMLNALPALIAYARRVEVERDSYANSDFERQLSEARAECERLRGLVVEACSLIQGAIGCVDPRDEAAASACHEAGHRAATKESTHVR